MIFTRNLKNVIIGATALAGYYQGNTTHGIKLNKVNKGNFNGFDFNKLNKVNKSKIVGNFNGFDVNGKLITRNKSCVKSEGTALYEKLLVMSGEEKENWATEQELLVMSGEEKENWATEQEGYAKYMERAAHLTGRSFDEWNAPRNPLSKVDNYYVKKLAPYINANGFAALRSVPVEGKDFGEKTGHYLFVDSISDFRGGKVKVLFNNEGYGENRIIDENRQAFFNEDEIATVPTLKSFNQHRKSNIVWNCPHYLELFGTGTGTKGKYLQQLHEMKFTELLALIAPQNEKEFQFGDMAKFVDGNTLDTSEIPLLEFNKLSRTVRVSCTKEIENSNKFEGKVLPFDATRLKGKYYLTRLKDYSSCVFLDDSPTYPVEGFVKALNLREI